VRVLERLVVSRATEATAITVRSTGASWAEFLRDRPDDGPRSTTSVHTHVHVDVAAEAGTPCISIDDVVTHYTAFPDPLAAAVVISVFADGRVVKVHGYGRDGLLHEEPAWCVLGEEVLDA
jgi:hypothetical protein